MNLLISYKNIDSFSSRTLYPSGLRTYNDIINSGAYVRPDYYPKPISMPNVLLTFFFYLFIYELISIETRTDQEKDRLANLMAYGTDPMKTLYKTVEYSSSPREIDRFDECM